MFLIGPWTSSQDYGIFFTQEDNVKSQFPSYIGKITHHISEIIYMERIDIFSGFKLLEMVPAT